MADLHIVTCVKVTPKAEEIRVDPETKLLERAGARSEINPPDMNAVELALGLKDRHGGRVNLLSMGPPLFEPHLRDVLAMGADHVYLMSDQAFAGADTLATTYTLARAIEKLGGADMVICGEESSDGATGQVPPGLAEWLGAGLISGVNSVTLDLQQRVAHGRREISGGYEMLEVDLPCVLSVKTAANEPRFMDYRIKSWAQLKEQVTIWTSADLEADPNLIGLTGSPTRVSGLEQADTRERLGIRLEGTPQEIADRLRTILSEQLH
ncbi:MAG: electron transfer flavoprotein subunit beta/FixA family protein [Chloroflexota bacterium]|nr:MAG: electron transfer flavoprotein subunit beta/FixA family protein [Chloroflexota bacterium]